MPTNKTVPWWQTIHPERSEHPAATAAKHPPTTTAAKHPPREDALRQSILRGNDQDTLGSKASASEEANDNGGKAYARETNDDQASAMEIRIAAKHPLWQPNDNDKVKCCRTNHYE